MSVTGYYISYIKQGDNPGQGNPVMRAESSPDIYNNTIDKLVVGATYTIYVSANSTTLPSTAITKRITLGMPVCLYRGVYNSQFYQQSQQIFPSLLFPLLRSWLETVLSSTAQSLYPVK